MGLAAPGHAEHRLSTEADPGFEVRGGANELQNVIGGWVGGCY